MNAQSASILIAIIGGLAGIVAAYVANRNRKDNQNIKKIIGNSNVPVETLEQVIGVIRTELDQQRTRHLQAIADLQNQIGEVRKSRDDCEADRAILHKQIEELRDKLKRNGIR